MKTTMKRIAILLLIVSFFAGTVNIVSAAGAPFRVVQTPTLHLYTGLSAAGTSLRVTPFPKDLDGNKLSMTDFGTTTYMTIDPKISGVEEIVSATGITDNGDGTGTLTGLARDLTSKYPYTTAGTGRQHSAGAIVVFSNNPQVYGSLGALSNDQNWLGINIFSSTTPPRLDQPAAQSTGTYIASTSEFATIAYVLKTTLSGAANSTQSVNGIVQLATALQAASSTNLGSTGASLVLQSKYATDTPGTLCSGGTTTGGCIPVSLLNGKLNQTWLDLTQAFTVSGLWSFTGATTTASSATTTLTSSSAGLGIGTTTPSLFKGGLSNALPTYLAQAVGIGIATSSSNQNLEVKNNVLVDNNLTVGGVCTNCVSGYEIITNTSAFQTSNGAQTAVTATCSAGKKVMGGGASSTISLSGQSNSYMFNNNYPSANNAWTVTYTCTTGGTCTSGFLGSYAICATI